MSSRSTRYYRQVVATVLRWFCELEDGVIPGASFDPRVLDYRLDVDRAMRGLVPRDRSVLMAIHRDGLGYASAVHQAGITVERPDAYVALLEVRTGKLFERKGLSDLMVYLNN